MLKQNNKYRLRPIVKDALKVSELDHQFVVYMVTDEQINDLYPDSYLVEEANYHLTVALQEYDNYDEETQRVCRHDIRQLERFIKKWKNKCQPHKNDGLGYDEIYKQIKK